MSKVNRLEWSKQIAVLNEQFKGFQADPSMERLEAAISQMRAYAEAARAGGIEIPQQFIAN